MNWQTKELQQFIGKQYAAVKEDILKKFILHDQIIVLLDVGDTVPQRTGQIVVHLTNTNMIVDIRMD